MIFPIQKCVGESLHANTDAFWQYYIDRSLTIGDTCMDGVSLTHSHYPRQHIWT